MRPWREVTAKLFRRSTRAVRAALSWVRDDVLVAVSWALLPAFGWALVSELFKSEPRVAVLSTSALFILLTALFAQHGGELLSRMRKLGPLELFARTEHDLFAKLDLEGKIIPAKHGMLEVGKEPLTKQEMHWHRQRDLYLSVLDFSGVDPTAGRHQRKYCDLLWAVFSTAFGLKDWVTAVARMEKLMELNPKNYDLARLTNYLGLTHFLWAQHSEDQEEQLLHYRKAAKCFSEAIEGRPREYLYYFYLAFAQDELGLHGLSASNNREVLKIKPRYAPAKYNLTITLWKGGKHAEAYEALKGIDVDDEEVMGIVDTYKADPEIKVMLDDGDWGAKTKELFEAL